MKKCKKVLALVLALVMLLSAACVGLSASATNVKNLYTGSALSGKMNSVDEYELTNEQYASIILDFVDKTLANANIPVMTIPLTSGLRIQINAKDINGINRTIIDLNALIDKASSFLGDIAKLDFSAFSTSTARDGKTSASDVRFITALVSFLSTKVNYEAIGKLVRKGLGTGSGQLNPGSIVNGFIPDNVKEITNDIVGFLKKTLFNDANASFDANIASMVTELINGLGLEMLEGYTFESTDSIYSTIDKIVRVLTKWVIKNIQADTWDFKGMILNAMPNFETEYPFVNLDGITEINWDWEADGMGKKFVAGTASTYIVYHINNLLGEVVSKVFPEFNSFKGSLGGGISSTAGWKKDNSTNSLNTLNQNIAKAAQYADIKLNGGTFTDEEAAALTNPTKTYAMVLADAIIKMFFPGIKVEKQDIVNGNIAILAVEALNEFNSYYIPENILTDLYTYNETGTVLNRTKYTESYCQGLYKNMLAAMIAKFTSGYFPVSFSNKNNLDAVLKDIVKYFMNTVAKAGTLSEGALGTISNSDTVYTAVDRIIFSLNTSGSYVEGASSNGGRNKTGILPQGVLPASYNTSKKLVDHLFNCVEGLNVGDLLKILVPNSSGTEMTTALFPNLVSYEIIRIINVLFPATWTSKTGSLDALLTNENLGNILEKILQQLNINYHIYPALKLVSSLMGLSSAQTRGEAAISLANEVTAGDTTVYPNIQPIINSSSTTVPSGYYLKVENTSKGINGGYHSNTGNEIQYEPYKLKVVSIVCENQSGVKVNNASEANIASADSQAFSISGTATLNTMLSFRVTFKMSEEMGRNYGDPQEARIYVYYGNPSMASGTSNSVTVSIPSVIYGTPSMFNNAVGYYRTNNAAATYSGAAEDSVFPKALTDAGFTFSASGSGTPETTANTQFNPFSVSVPSTVDINDYAGTYNITYNLKTIDTSNSDASYSGNTAINTKWVLFDDAGLEGLVSQYTGMDLQAADFSNTALWNAFAAELNKAEVMLNNPGATATTPAALKAAFAAEVETLTAAYEALAESSTADYTELLKARLVEYADGDAENNIRPKYTRWDYATVGYTRYAKSLSAVRNYYNNKEKSSVKVTEALRYNEAMAKTNVLFPDAATDTSKAAALNNLKSVYNTFNAYRANYNPTNYTPESTEAILEALDQGASVIGGTGLDGTSEPKVSDYADARNDILAALNKLIAQPLNISALYSKVNAAKEQYNDNMYYTDDAWNVYEKALDAANTVINDPLSLLPKDYTAADVASVNAQITSQYIPNLESAIQVLQANPYVSSLSGMQKGAVAYDFGKKIVAGARVINASDYIIVAPGAKYSDLNKLFEFSKNTSRYTKDAEGNWNTYCSVEDTPTFKVYKANGSVQSSAGARLRTGWTVEVSAPSAGISNTYTIVVTGSSYDTNPNPTTFTKSRDTLATILPNVIANVGVDTFTDAQILSCDLNSDGRVDNTDLVLLKMWQNGTYVPYNTF